MNLPLALVAAAAAQSASPPLTFREAQALSPPELAARVLGMAGSTYREARVESGEGGPFGANGSAFIRFASRPRWSGNPGLCIADTVFVSFSLIGHRQAGADRRMRLRGFDADHVYRIVGDTTDRREGTDESERALEAQCARSGPVLADWTTQRFFGGQRLGGAEAFLTARMLQTAIAQARRGAVNRLSCTEANPAHATQACADPRSVLAGLATDRLRYVQLDRCADNAAHLCADLTFEQGERRGNELTTLRVILEVDVARADPPPDSFRILAVTIRHETGIED